MAQDQKVRVRFAPSPTGYLHIGGVRTLWFNWLYARRWGGKLILRIDDTDQQRSTPENEKMMMEDIHSLGIEYDEGPDRPGDYGPYRQSERFDLYAKYAKQLLDEDKAYYCFCSADLITQKREAAMKMGKMPIYDGTCAHQSKEEALKRISAGEKAGLRMRAPSKDYVLEDLVRGKITFQSGTIGDFLITRTPTDEEKEAQAGIGMPVYNFSCVIDDALMKLTHIIRGEDHLSNTARQLMIYEALKFDLPIFAHTAMVLGTDRLKLSKRNGDVSTKQYLDQGYFSETLLNFLSLLGWWPPQGITPASGHPEVMTPEEMIKVFGTEGMQKAPAVFDVQKMKWMNSFYMKMLPLEKVTSEARPFFEKDPNWKNIVSERGDLWFEKVIGLFREEVSLLSELPMAAQLLMGDTLTLDEDSLNFLKKDKGLEVVEALKMRLNHFEDLSDSSGFKELQKEIGTELGVKGKGLFMPIRIALTGQMKGPDLSDVLPLLGASTVQSRIQSVIHQVKGQS
ncbi:MAG: glutamate--tRNA ligase [Bdellovibrionaceae bacterium]|nr:glutamate--tRNA ligase [Pseudobdellovibrionaceae bacterium]|tara:strand:+ start:5136 stop:6665 length:1530 start_codon:yes stop_codon:yes gene_type:complete